MSSWKNASLVPGKLQDYLGRLDKVTAGIDKAVTALDAYSSSAAILAKIEPLLKLEKGSIVSFGLFLEPILASIQALGVLFEGPANAFALPILPEPKLPTRFRMSEIIARSRENDQTNSLETTAELLAAFNGDVNLLTSTFFMEKRPLRQFENIVARKFFDKADPLRPQFAAGAAFDCIIFLAGANELGSLMNTYSALSEFLGGPFKAPFTKYASEVQAKFDRMVREDPTQKSQLDDWIAAVSGQSVTSLESALTPDTSGAIDLRNFIQQTNPGPQGYPWIRAGAPFPIEIIRLFKDAERVLELLIDARRSGLELLQRTLERTVAQAKSLLLSIRSDIRAIQSLLNLAGVSYIQISGDTGGTAELCRQLQQATDKPRFNYTAGIVFYSSSRNSFTGANLFNGLGTAPVDGP